MTAIYSLKDPKTGRIRYVGKTDRPLCERFAEHIRSTKSKHAKHTRKNRWVAKLLRQGLRPIIGLIEVVPVGQSWERAEALWITKYRNLYGDSILNLVDGGRGASGRKHTDETKRKLSIAMTGRPGPRKNCIVSDETRRKLSASLKGKPVTLAMREKISLANRGQKRTAEQRLRLCAGAKKRMETAEGREQVNRARAAANAARKAAFLARSAAA